MVTLSRLNGTVVAINPDLITWIDVTPDTIVSLLGGDKIIVREPLDEVIARIVAFRRAVGSAVGTANATGKDGAVTYLAALRTENAHSGRYRSSAPPPPRPSNPPARGPEGERVSVPPRNGTPPEGT